jgi:hypothetical protein
VTSENVKDLRAKILQRIKLSNCTLLAFKLKEYGELVISMNGKIVKVKAKELSNP